MSGWSLAASTAGGVGLFLLGMTMMTDGLRLLAGPSLARMLAGATRNRWMALGSGIAVTAIVQSSSAVTVAAIGFVNAGLLGLTPALWVLFGANVGTTMTGWLVALIGLKFKIEALALPLIGLGAVLRLTGEGRRHGSLGAALAGFGVLFLGISMLQQSFTGLAAQVTLPQVGGVQGVVVLIGVGMLLTVLMQSSSASMAIALTAAQGGLLGLQDAAAMVIGANIGTTVTAMIAAIGATPNARRTASAHVVFNGLTGLVALVLLPWMVKAIGMARSALGLSPEPAVELALFHTVFNVLGVALMWPISDRLDQWLRARFRTREEDAAQAQFLDKNVLQVPALALDALRREVARIGHVTVRMARTALSGTDPATLREDHRIVARLETTVEEFVEQMNRGAMSARASERLAGLLRMLRYYMTVSEQAVQASAKRVQPLARTPLLLECQRSFAERADALLVLCDPDGGDADPQLIEAQRVLTEAAYDALKDALLSCGASGSVTMSVMEEDMTHYSAVRRAVQQAAKAALRKPVADNQPHSAA